MSTKELIDLSARYPHITVRWLATLMTINENEGCSISTLSQITGVSAYSLATAIRRFEARLVGNPGDKLIEVERHPGDKRYKLLWLTDKGRSACLSINRKNLVNLSNQCPRLNARTLATLIAIGENSGRSISELSQILDVPEKSLATTIRHLDEGKAGSLSDKLIKVEPCDGDKRYKLVYLTAKGRSFLNKFWC